MAVPSLYGLGWAFLGICSFIDPPMRRYYVGAAVCFTVAVVWSLAALYTHDSLKKPRVKYPKNRSEPSSDLPRRRRRRRNKKSRKVVAFVAVLLYAGTSYKLARSYEAFRHPPQSDNFEVFVRTSSFKMRALRVPSQDNPQDTSGMTFALANIPVIDLPLLSSTEKTRLTVVVRNIGGSDVGNTRILVNTNGQISPVGADTLATLSPTQAQFFAPKVSVGKDGEVSFPIDIELAKNRISAGLLIMVQSEDADPYTAAVKVQMVEQ